MKKSIFGCAIACALLATIASNPCFAQECFSGFYVGGNVGVASHLARLNDTDGFLTDNSGWSLMDTNVVGGAQIGYDRQCGNCVIGLVADWNGGNLDSLLQDNAGAASDNSAQSELDWYSTIRLRTGLAVNNALLYVSAGPAVAGIDTTWHDAPDTFASSKSLWGWAGSVGTEYKWSRNVSVGVEMLYLNFSDHYTTFTDGSSNDYTFGNNDSVWSGRMLVNYRFGG